MIHFILFLALLCSPDGTKADKGKPKGTVKLSQPAKGTLVVPGNQSATALTGTEEQLPAQKQPSPYVTNAQMVGVSSAGPQYNSTYGDTAQKLTNEPVGFMKWEP